MDLSPIYELRNRLRAAMIAGTNLLSEDFRLKKAVEGFAPLASASPVFGKINELAAGLSKNNSPETLLDMITLTDAVITTLGTTEVSGELKDIPIDGSNAVIVNAPYSQLSPIIDALTNSGGFSTINTAYNENLELFKDYRVKPALVKGLGASSAADTAAQILKKQGKEIIPLVKKGFDPKGKKEMVRRVGIIEEVCGTEENDFYLEQLQDAEKDVRKALIYVLRHDKRNIDKLIELAKTEKGKMKTTALAALMSFDDEEAEGTALIPFFDEYSKKKPAEVLELLRNASSKWTSRLAVRLINSVLVDKDGNEVTLSEVMDGKTELKAKVAWFVLLGALYGKWGNEIESIYRELDPKGKTPVVNNLTMYLGESIAATGDEGLKALAVELNNAPKTKDQYIFAESVSKLTGSGDNSDWLAEQILAAYERQQNDKHNADTVHNAQITMALRKIFLEDGKYYFNNAKYDPISETWAWRKPIPVTQPIKGAISDALMKCPCWENFRILGDFIDENDKEYCQKIGNYLLEKNGNSLNTYELLGYLTKCGLRNIKGFLVKECKLHTSPVLNTLQSVIKQLPGDDEYRLSEVRDLVDNLRRGKIKMKNIDTDMLLAWAETGMK